MAMRRTALAVGLLALLIAATLPGSGAAQTPRKGGRVVVVSSQEPKTLLPHLDLLTLSREVQRLVFERALALSRETYCSVWHSLRQDIELTTSFDIEKARVP